ncbi:MAG: helix-turn-helix domain-containing protein [Myxococcota bacterium]
MPAFDHQGRTYNNPVQLALDLIGGKWKMPILWRLRNKTLRYSELRRSLNQHLDTGKVTDKMLASQLRDLERHGLIARRVYPVVPPKVEYSITKRGLRAIPSIEVLRKFGNDARRW